ncbi:hypothetical protein P7K49_027047 [Saguinus oedipus]|uniref:Uncharacterized protein n=1 Tax=Saguinus oedipus TaxID=9490 RepID=A0ABQ9UFG1_SAGOE|nr:hypothetical protein P7K49_027047 [Saguinus oedipus]
MQMKRLRRSRSANSRAASSQLTRQVTRTAGKAAGGRQILRTRRRRPARRPRLGLRRSCSSLVGSWVSSAWSTEAAASAAPHHSRDALSGVRPPVGDRTAARLEEDCIVGGHRVPRPQGLCLSGGLLQQALEAGRRREHRTLESRTPSPASRPSAGRTSEGWCPE